MSILDDGKYDVTKVSKKDPDDLIIYQFHKPFFKNCAADRVQPALYADDHAFFGFFLCYFHMI